jgi:hypothetical protein
MGVAENFCGWAGTGIGKRRQKTFLPEPGGGYRDLLCIPGKNVGHKIDFFEKLFD